VRASRERELAFTSYLRLGAMAAVVGVHTLASIVSNDAIRGSATWWVATALDLGSSWCVPLFIMVSGTLLLEPDGLGAGAFYRRRLRRIAIPLVVAHVGYFALRAVGGEHLTPSIIVHDLLHATVYTQLYFFWIILGLYLVTPLLRRVIGGDPRVALATGAAALAWMVAVSSGAAMLHAIGQPVAIWQPAALTLWVPYLGYFVLGYALRSWVAGPGALAAAVASFLLADALVVWHYTVGLRFAVADVLLGGGYQSLPVAVSAVALFVIGRRLVTPGSRLAAPALAPVARTLGALTLGVFIVHVAILRLARALPMLGFADATSRLPLALVLFAVALTGSFALCALVARVPVLRRSIGL